MDLNDHRWAKLRGGYKDRYDPRLAVANLVANDDPGTVWAELWNELHHLTFTYDRKADTWQWKMDGEEKGQLVPFARVTLRHKRRGRPTNR